MPELPEVETMRRGVAIAAGSRIVGVEKLRCPRKPIAIEPTLTAFRRRTVDAHIERSDRAGKRVVLWLDTSDAIVFEPRMTGIVLVTDPPDPRYSRLRLRLQGGSVEEIVYWDRRGLGSVKLLTTEEFAERFGPHALGPDALTMTAEMYQERLGRSLRPVKVALLDQKCVSGIGNLYAAEILHLAGIHPACTCRGLTKRQWAIIAEASMEVLERAIRYEGSTLSDGTYRSALNKAGNYQNEHRVYDKAGSPCPRRGCRGAIERVVMAQRATFFCPRCQRNTKPPVC